MKRTSLTPLGLRVLGVLVGATEPARRSALARAVGVDKGSVTRVVRDLLAMGCASEDTGSGGRLAATEKGRRAWDTRDERAEQPTIDLAAPETAPAGLTPREWQVLAAIAQREDAGDPPAPGELAKLLGVTRAAVNRHIRRLSEAGLVEARGRTVALQAVLTPAGRELRAAAAAHAPLLPARLPDDALPARVGLTPRALEVLRFIVAEAREGRVPVYDSIATRCGVRVESIFTVVETLERGGFVSRLTSLPTQHGHRLRVTPLGLAVADGRVPVVSPQRARSTRVAARREPAVAPMRAQRAAGLTRGREPTERPAPAASRPAQPAVAPAVVVRVAAVMERPAGDVTPRYVRDLEGERRTSDVRPVPVGFDPNAPRPIKHPSPSSPLRPADMSAARWRALTSPPVLPIHDACARGTA